MSKKNRSIILEELKERKQDKEWYPTTNEIIDSFVADLKQRRYSFSYYDFSILDIGAGDGKVLDASGAKKKYAIEQSQVLIDNMPKYIYTIGRDFHDNDLTDKEVDIIFCNPPYSEYAQWVSRIILEARAKYAYLVIPERWEDNQMISSSLKERGVSAFSIGNFSFEDSEDRKARANVQLIRVDLVLSKINPFTIAFKQLFAEEIARQKQQIEEEPEEKDSFDIVDGANVIESLLYIYTNEMSTVQRSYKAVMNLDYGVLNEIGFDVEKAAHSLQQKLSGLKTLYWDRLFSHFDKITDRLTVKSRREMLDTINAGKMIDFTRDNITMVILWAIRNANKYYDNQLVALYRRMSDPSNVKNFKSNKKWIDDKWRFLQDASHYKLDTRIIIGIHQGLGDWNFGKTRLSQGASEILGDILTIANNLGFFSKTKIQDHDWSYGTKYDFYTGNNILMQIKFYKKGTLHIKFDRIFLQAFNIEAARILGWIKSPHEAAEEMGIDKKSAMKFFGKSFQLDGNTRLLVNAKKYDKIAI